MRKTHCVAAREMRCSRYKVTNLLIGSGGNTHSGWGSMYNFPEMSVIL